MNFRELLFNSNFCKGECSLELLSVTIEGFRNIDKNTIIFNGLTSLVSTNSYGKSNLMKAIEFAVDFIKYDKEIKEKMMKSTSGIPLNKYIENKNFIADFNFSYNNLIVNYGFEFSWIKNDDKGAEIVGEWLYSKLNKKGQKFNKLISRSSQKALYKSSTTGRCSNIINVSKNELIINKLLGNENLFFHEIVEEINKMNVYIDRHLDTTFSYQPSPFIKRGEDEFDLNIIENIPRAIYALKRKYPDKYSILEDAYLQLFPNIKSIDVKEYEISATNKSKLDVSVPYILSDKVYVMHVEDYNLNQPIRFDRLSDGAKRVFLMLTYAVLADIKGLKLIAFEEPENSVHPSLLQSYLNVIMQLANNCKIIIASHSPYILQYVSTSDIYIGVPNDKGIADFHRIANSKVKILHKDASEAGESVGNYIFDLLSGTEDDIEILSGYLEK